MILQLTEETLLRKSKTIAAKEYLSELPEGCSDWVEAFDAITNFTHPDPYLEVNDIPLFLFWGTFDGCLFSEVVDCMENLKDSIYDTFIVEN